MNYPDELMEERTMTIELEFPPDVQSLLERQAASSGRNVASFVLDLVRERLADDSTNGSLGADVSDAEWSARLHAWAESFPPVTHHVDDSRHSIYTDRS